MLICLNEMYLDSADVRKNIVSIARCWVIHASQKARQV